MIYWVIGTVLVLVVTVAGIWAWHMDNEEQAKFHRDMKAMLDEEQRKEDSNA